MWISKIGTALSVAAIFVSVVKADDASVVRGKYLVDEVAKCGMCHTPADETGKPDASRYLKGGALNFQPMQAVEKWHKTAPDITSTSRLWQRWGDAGFVKFLETAAGPTGHPADPPMPAYKMSHEDAQAIADYLKSLK
jgi:mono/diheme cytochrome c family protein